MGAVNFVLIVTAIISVALTSIIPVLIGIVYSLFIITNKKNENKAVSRETIERLEKKIESLEILYQIHEKNRDKTWDNSMALLERRISELESHINIKPSEVREDKVFDVQNAVVSPLAEKDGNLKDVPLPETVKPDLEAVPVKSKPVSEKKAEPEVAPVVVPAVEQKEAVAAKEPVYSPGEMAVGFRETALEKKIRELWANVQHQFIENWTGILGSIIMVMGVGFLGGYTALKVEPVYRFVMLVGASAVLLGLFFFLNARAKWLRLALWLRSSAGAIFLFACLGSGGIEELKWIENPLYALALLCLGIAVNLYLGYIGGSQVFASLHVTLSLAALSAAPAASLTLTVAAVVSLFGIALTYREKWQYHLILTISLFFGYHFYWYLRIGSADMTRPQHLIGIITVVAVSLLAILVHYRSLYKTEGFERLPFFIHFVTWVYFGIGLYVHSMGSIWKPLIIAAGSAAAFMLARRAKRIGIPWLYVTDTLMAQAIALAAFFSLYRLDVQFIFVAGLMFVETLVFLVVMIKSKEELLIKIGTVIKLLLGLMLLVTVFMTSGQTEFAVMQRHLLTLAVCVVAIGAYFLFLLNKQGKGTAGTDEIGETGFHWLPVSYYFAPFFYMATTLYACTVDWQWKWIVLAAMSVISYLVFRPARVRGLKYLYRTGAMVAQVIAMMAILMLENRGIELHFIFGGMLIETLAFQLLMIKEKEDLLRRIGTVLMVLAGSLLIVRTLDNLTFQDETLLYQHFGTLLAGGLATVLFHVYALKKIGESFDAVRYTSSAQADDILNISFSGLLTGVTMLAAGIHSYRIPWAVYLLVAAGVLLTILTHQLKSDGLGIGMMVFITGIHFAGWSHMDVTAEKGAALTGLFLYGLPFFALSFTLTKKPIVEKWTKYIKAFGIYLFTAHLVVTTLHLFSRVSEFLPGISWLVISVVLLESACYLRKKYGDGMVERGEADRYLLYAGYMVIVVFLVRHLGMHLRDLQTVGGISLRLLTSLAGIVTFIYWALRPLPQREGQGKSREYLHPLLLELVLWFSILTVAVEVNYKWFPLVWLAMAFFLLLAGRNFEGMISRIRFYSLMFYWASTVYTAVVPALESVNGTMRWNGKTGLICIAAILVQFVYIALTHRIPFLKSLQFPKSLPFLPPLAAVIEKKKNLWIHYPLFFSAAFFLYQTFDKSILTLLWVVECFLIFLLAVVLKENLFRYLAMTGLGLSMIRLVFYDLAKSDTLTRALVFIGVGVLMLTVNSVYNKYKERF
jgi:hypothetical protein